MGSENPARPSSGTESVNVKTVSYDSSGQKVIGNSEGASQTLYTKRPTPFRSGDKYYLHGWGQTMETTTIIQTKNDRQ